MFNFLFKFANITSELHRMLGLRFVPGHPSNDTPLGRSVANLIELKNSGEHELLNLEISRLDLLVKHFREIEYFNPALLQHFKRELKKSRKSSDNFYSLRFEINIAASFIRKRISFTKTEAPDFTIDNTPIAVECSSTRISKQNIKLDLSYKIVSCIHKKEKRGYNTSYVALFIDITNISSNSFTYPDLEHFRKEARKSMSYFSFGSLVLFMYVMNKELQRFESNYIRIDHKNISHELKEFLDTHYPFAGHEVPVYIIPHEG